MQTSSVPVRVPVVSRLSAGRLQFEIYKDGECVVDIPGIFGGQQLSIEFIANLARQCKIPPETRPAHLNTAKQVQAAKPKPLKAKSAPRKPAAKAGALPAQAQTDDLAKTPRILDRGEFRRKISALGPMAVAQPDNKAITTENAWECVFTHRKTGEAIRHVYLNRPSARLGRISVVLGTFGRIQ